MQKKLIALAIAGAIAAPAAFAADSAVTIYGQLDMSIDSIHTDSTSGASNADGTLTRVSSNASRIGFKGAEDLGNGLKATWQIEQQVGMENGSGAFGGSDLRNTYVGLGGGFGEVRVGRHDTPYKMSTGKLDIFADTMGDYNTIIGASGLNLGNLDANLTQAQTDFGARPFDLRATNAIAYITPDFSGFTGAIAYVAGNENGTQGFKNGAAWSLAGMYENGPIFASLAYEKLNNMGQVDVNANGISDVSVDAKSTKAGFGYNFGDTKVGVVLERNEVPVSFDDSLAANNGATLKRNAYYLNVAHTMGAVTLKAAYGKARDWTGTDGLGATGATNYVVGVDYAMSKRTKLYALYTKVNNDQADAASGNPSAAYTIGGGAGGSYTPEAGRDPSAWSFGVRHNF